MISDKQTPRLMYELFNLIRDPLFRESGDEQKAAQFTKIVGQFEKASKEEAGEDIVRVMRLYVFEGERKTIEDQLNRSLGDGTKVFGPNRTKIHVATIGSFPEIMTTVASSDGHPIREDYGPAGGKTMADHIRESNR